MLLLACVATTGFLWAGWHAQQRIEQRLPAAWEGVDVVLDATLAGPPRRDARGLRFEAHVARVLTRDAPRMERMRLNWYGTARAPGAGETWRLTVRLKRPRGDMNFHGFDAGYALLESGVDATGYVREGVFVHGPASPGAWIAHARGAVIGRILETLGAAPHAGVLAALAVGEQRAIPREQWTVFTRTGVNHLMSISGLHVTMVAGFAGGLAAWLWRRVPRLALRVAARRAGMAVAMLAALAYTLLAGFGVPAQRTLYMLAAAVILLWRGRVSGPFDVLAFALFVVVAIDPWAVRSAGFWLSFGAVGAMVWVVLGRVDPVGRGTRGKLATWGRVQAAVTLALAPVLLLLFQQVSLVSPLANAFAIPLVSLAVTPLTLLASVPGLDALYHPAHSIMSLTYAGLAWLAALPDAVWVNHAPPGWAVGFAIVGSAWMLMPRGWPARWVGAVAWLPLLFAPLPRPEPGTAWVEVLDVGQGLAVLVRTERHALLYDAGPAWDGGDAGERSVLPHLRAEGVRRLDALVLSHDDSDHTGGARAVRGAIPIDRTWLGQPVPGVAGTPCRAGLGWAWDGVRFELLHPQRAYQGPRRDNDRSCVLRVSTGPDGAAALLTGDIERIAELELVDRQSGRLAAALLVAPHHGSRTSSTAAFLDRVAPGHVAIAAGYRNRFGHPHGEVLARYHALRARIARTDRDGALRYVLDGESVGLVTARETRRRYWD